MTTEPHRLQYLEAMGLTAWVARYRLPNARPTEACEWEPEPAGEAGSRAPGERLHALLDDAAEASSTSAPSNESTTRPSAGQGRARALLGIWCRGGVRFDRHTASGSTGFHNDRGARRGVALHLAGDLPGWALAGCSAPRCRSQ
nr:hypothetical protein [Halomonas elongata]